MAVKSQQTGARRNTLLRYRKIMEEFNKYDCRDIPITVIHRKYIYPKFFISRDTLYRIFATQIEEELSAIPTQLSLFDQTENTSNE